ncbi:MAG: hypothetical protein O9284_07720 [Steroidobacteraceae bacterium]|nr:hypothetical protein [Steroidobacteraceae bacterium]
MIVDEAVTWPDGSLGCPEPGMAYAMALVPGYRVILRFEAREYACHASARGGFKCCATPGMPLPREAIR